MVNKILFYVANTLDPHVNLAKEKVLFDMVDDESAILYLWQNANTVVIGKNQNAYLECRTQLLDEEGGKLARRLSGGGAVYHDVGNLNFTFISTTPNYDLGKNMAIIQSACQKAGLSTTLSGRNDILLDGRKFSGNAFYNHKGRSYHHGTILINADLHKLSRYLTPPKAKLETKGIKSVRSRVINLTEFAPDLTIEDMRDYLISAFAEEYSLTPTVIDELDDREVTRLAEYYSSHEFVYGSQIPFNVNFEGLLSFGNVTCHLNVVDRVMTSVQFYTDALDASISQIVEDALTHQPFDLNAIRRALETSLHDNEAKELIDLIESQIFS
ncbi:MAG: lipoate--protein ligase [Clostridia bacterium]|nr:lipoate--protein ligase [Clostridia bacterium]